MSDSASQQIGIVSVCICTFNRADYLSETLASLKAAIRVSQHAVEILVVDNASTDHTKAVTTDFISSNPDITTHYHHEPQNGLSFARNTALNASNGEIICFLDDDVIVSQGWVAGIVAGFRLDSDVAAVAGQVLPDWGGVSIPRWLDKRYQGFYGICTWGDRSFVMPRGEVFVGCNFALRRWAIERVGLFDTLLGRRQGLLLSGEDDDYAQRICESGYAIAYAPAGLVHHRIDAQRISFGWLLRRYFWQGVTSALRPKNRKIAYPLRQLPRLLIGIMIMPIIVLCMSRQMLFHTCFRIASAVGPLYGCYLLRTRRTTDGEQDI